jgi:hypothetical protein
VEIRRSAKNVELQSLPLDGLDMFLISRLEGAVSLSELVTLVPAEPAEVVRRAKRLVALGILEAHGMPSEAWKNASLPIVLSPESASVELQDLDGALTLPPSPAKKKKKKIAERLTVSDDDAVTIPPASPTKAALTALQAASGRSMAELFERGTGPVAMRSLPEDDLRVTRSECDDSDQPTLPPKR